MSDIVERLDEIIAKNVALEISGMSEAIKAHYRAAFCAEAADTIQRLQAELSSLKASAKDARAEALEEAAQAAERFEAEYASERDKHVHGTPDHWMNNSGSYAAMDIAAAIRRLKEGA